MKKLLSLLIVVLLSLSIVACNKNPDTDNGGNNTSNNEFDTNKITFASAYAKAQNLGFEGTLDEFIELISGKDGADGKPGADGKDGTDGKDGADGVDGTDGKDGVGIEKVEFDDNGNLVITYTDGTTQTIVLPADSEIHKHVYGEWVSYGGSTEMLFSVCKTCKEIVWKFGTCSTHTFTTTTVAPTCTAEGYDHNICSICDYEEKVNYTNIVAHDYATEYSRNNSFHWYDCKNCDATTAKAEHTIDGWGYCRVCDQLLAPTEVIIYELSADGTYAEVIGYIGTATKIVIADTYEGVPVTGIYDKAFYNNDSITSVVIPDSVTSIGDEAFYDCDVLTSVSIGNGVTSIGDYAFYDCDGLTSVTIPDSVTSIGYGAFSYCDGLTSITIPDSVTSIGLAAFSNCYGLTSVSIGNGVTSISYAAFFGCSGLTSVNISDIAAWCNIFFYDSYSTPLHCAKNLYLNGELITELVIPDSVTSIGNYAFDGCSSLTSVIIPDSVTSIGDCAFAECDNLTDITIVNGVTSIGEWAFYYCSSLTSVTIGNGVTSIGRSAFSDCTSLTSVNISDIAAWCNISFYDSLSNPLSYAKNLYLNGELITELVIPDGVTSIGNYAFCNCDGLTSVTIGNSVTSIGDYAFAWCDSLTSVTIPDSVEFIGNYAFAYCSGLTSITIPDSVTSIGDYAFDYCSSLKNVYYTGSEEEWKAISIGSDNSPLTKATKHYNYVPEEE